MSYDLVNMNFIATKLELKGQGYSRQLMELLFDEIKTAHKKRGVTICTTRSGDFYEKCGMTEWGRIKKFQDLDGFDKPFDRVALYKLLDS